jgi:hypothetical protein
LALEALTGDDRRALAHICGRTTMGKFASGLHGWSGDRWRVAVDRLRSAGFPIRQVCGVVADDPAVTGGWVIANADHEHRVLDTS